MLICSNVHPGSRGTFGHCQRDVEILQGSQAIKLNLSPDRQMRAGLAKHQIGKRARIDCIREGSAVCIRSWLVLTVQPASKWKALQGSFCYLSLNMQASAQLVGMRDSSLTR